MSQSTSSFSDSSRCVSHSPSRDILWLSISCSTCAAFSPSNMVLMLQVTIFVILLGVRKESELQRPDGFHCPASLTLGVTYPPKIGLLALYQSLLPRGEMILFVRPPPVDMEHPTRSPSSPGHRATQAFHLEVEVGEVDGPYK